jgi:hypothetical protein
VSSDAGGGAGLTQKTWRRGRRAAMRAFATVQLGQHA